MKKIIIPIILICALVGVYFFVTKSNDQKDESQTSQNNSINHTKSSDTPTYCDKYDDNQQNCERDPKCEWLNYPYGEFDDENNLIGLANAWACFEKKDNENADNKIIAEKKSCEEYKYDQNACEIDTRCEWQQFLVRTTDAGKPGKPESGLGVEFSCGTKE